MDSTSHTRSCGVERWLAKNEEMNGSTPEFQVLTFSCWVLIFRLLQKQNLSMGEILDCIRLPFPKNWVNLSQTVIGMCHCWPLSSSVTGAPVAGCKMVPFAQFKRPGCTRESA